MGAQLGKSTWANLLNAFERRIDDVRNNPETSDPPAKDDNFVALPFNKKLPSLGSFKTIAMKRLVSFHSRFQCEKQLETEYRAIIQEYLQLGYMTRITTDDSSDNGYYLPHHGVVRESSQTTKLRIMFEGSAPNTTGVFLNDTLHAGPKLQEDLFDILLRYCSCQYVHTCDVEKVFLVPSEDTKYQ